MASYKYWSGKCKWARTSAPDQWGNWKVTLYPTPETLEEIRELQTQGLKTTIQKDEDGYYVTLRRPQEKNYGGKIKGFAPPVVLNADGSPAGNVMIGNGSDVTVKVEVYKYNIPASNGKKGVAIRMEAIRINNLVPYEKDSFPEDQALQVKGLDEQPQPIW